MKLKPLYKKLIIAGVCLLAALIVFFSATAVVPAGSTGVVTTFGAVSENVLQEGFNVVIPFVQQVNIISNKIQKQEVAADAVSKDLQSVGSTLAVNYRVGLNDSAKIYKNIGADYANIVLLPAVQESMKSVSAQYTAEELITKRNEVGTKIKEQLVLKVESYGIVIEQFNIMNFDFSEEFNAAIEAKQVAEQNLIKTKTEQEQKIVVANADAEQKQIAAEAEAKATRTKADAQAEANKKLSASLNANVIEYEKITKWDGKLPYASGGSPIIDFRSDTTAE
jgi:regulator of protease activity HflC (stomatin/prohibitin superfamily)